MALLLGYAFIFLGRVVDVSLGTFRTLMVVQGRKLQAALIGFCEVTIYVVVLGKVVNDLSNPMSLLSYSLGYACGNYVGIAIENKIGLGNLATQIILMDGDNKELIRKLRENKFGVTVIQGEGREGRRDILNVVIKRKSLESLRKIVYQYDEKAFITVNNINPISGGYFTPIKK